MDILFQIVTSFFWTAPFIIKVLIEWIFPVRKPFVVSVSNKCFKYTMIFCLFTEVIGIAIKLMKISREQKYFWFSLIFIVLNAVLFVVLIVLYRRNKWRPFFEFQKLNETELSALKSDIHQFLEITQGDTPETPSSNDKVAPDFRTIETNQFLQINIIKKPHSTNLMMIFKPDSKKEISEISHLMSKLNQKYRKHVKAPFSAGELKPFLWLLMILFVMIVVTFITDNLIPYQTYLILNVILVVILIVYSIIQDFRVDNASFYYRS